MKALYRRSNTGYSLIELLIYAMITVLVGSVAYSALRTGTMLSAKNLSINRSHNALRESLDRLSRQLQASRNVPTLLDTTGVAVSSVTAAGLRYDRVIGEPYVLSPVLTAGSVVSTATTLTVFRSVTASGAPPIPNVSDSLIIDTPSGTSIRARITAVATSPASGGTQQINLTFAAPLGQSFSWGANQPQWARLVRQEAFLVTSNNGRTELRHYHTYEPQPTMSDTTKYTLVSDQLSTAAGDLTPFSVTTTSGDKIVQANLRMQSRDHDQWLGNKQSNAFNTYFRINVSLSSRLRPKIN